MKTNYVVLALLMVIGSVINVNGLDKPKAPANMAVLKAGSTFKLYYKNVKSGNVKVTIYDSKGKEVFEESFTDVENFVRPYNFSALKEGEYTITLENEEGKQSTTINYSNEKIASLVKMKNNRFVVAVPNKSSNEITVSIFDAAKKLVYTSTHNTNSDFAGLYNVSKLSGELTIEVSDNNGFIKSFNY